MHLDAHFTAAPNKPFERHVFRAMTQRWGERVDQFPARLGETVEQLAAVNQLAARLGETVDQFAARLTADSKLSLVDFPTTMNKFGTS